MPNAEVKLRKMPYILDNKPDDQPRRPWAYYAAEQENNLRKTIGDDLFHWAEDHTSQIPHHLSAEVKHADRGN